MGNRYKRETNTPKVNKAIFVRDQVISSGHGHNKKKVKSISPLNFGVCNPKNLMAAWQTRKKRIIANNKANIASYFSHI